MNLKIWMTCALLLGTVVAPAADPVAASAPAATTAISQADLLARLESKDPDLVVLDVRTPAEFAAGHVPGARNLSHDQLPGKIAELASLKDKQIVLYCRSGRRSGIAAQSLREAGFKKLLQLEGDYPAWEAAGHPTEKLTPR